MIFHRACASIDSDTVGNYHDEILPWWNSENDVPEEVAGVAIFEHVFLICAFSSSYGTEIKEKGGATVKFAMLAKPQHEMDGQEIRCL